MKNVNEMTQVELAIESKKLNTRISTDKRQSWRERYSAKQKLANMGEYLKFIKQLYR